MLLFLKVLSYIMSIIKMIQNNKVFCFCLRKRNVGLGFFFFFQVATSSLQSADGCVAKVCPKE